MIKTVQNLIDSKKGDKKRLDDILNTIKQGTPLYLSDYRYLESLDSKNDTVQNEDTASTPQVTPSKTGDEELSTENLDELKPEDDAMTILRSRLANGEISIEEFRTIKKILQDNP